MIWMFHWHRIITYWSMDASWYNSNVKCIWKYPKCSPAAVARIRCWHAAIGTSRNYTKYTILQFYELIELVFLFVLQVKTTYRSHKLDEPADIISVSSIGATISNRPSPWALNPWSLHNTGKRKGQYCSIVTEILKEIKWHYNIRTCVERNVNWLQ